MKKITALLLCFLLLCICSVSVLADDVHIFTQVPATHKLTVLTDGAKVFFEGLEGTEFTVERLSEPRVLIRAESGKVLSSITLNGKDVTDELDGGYLAGAELELRSTLKTTTTDENGHFSFTEVELGKHSLTAVNEQKVVGYLAFEMIEDVMSDVLLVENGTYTVTIDPSGAGVELDLVLNEAMGIIAPTGAVTIARPIYCLWWFWLLIVILCIVVGIVSFIIHRKKKTK